MRLTPTVEMIPSFAVLSRVQTHGALGQTAEKASPKTKLNLQDA